MKGKNLENTNKHTKIQKLFSSKLFQIFFFIFLFLVIFYSFQILFSSIGEIMYFMGQYDKNDLADAFAYIGVRLILTVVIILPLTLFSTIIFFKQTKKFILFKTNFKFSFYILFFICIYSIFIIITVNTELAILLKDFSIYKMLICIIIALIATFSFKKLINFTLKDKK